MSGIACWPLLGAYQISKYAIEAISDTLRQELLGTDIQVGCIEPGPHKTGWAIQYARHTDINPSYNSSDLKARSSCGYTVQDPTASLPFFWKMFDTPVMPRRIATTREFVDFAIQEAQDKIQDWRAAHE
jgi:NAD(P)-dependent dehydrogenase (short-subunit alcohol dehydrogenase family)